MAENLGSIYAELRLSFAKIDNDIKQATTKLGTIANSFKETGDSLQKVGQKISKVGSTLTKKVTLPIIGLATTFVKMGADFDATMSTVQAITGATGEEFEKLREQAKYLGATTQFSAQDAAEGMAMLARAGWDVASIMSAMPGLLNLAAAGNLDLATASSITADTMTMFNMAMEDSVRAADVFAKAANSANTTVELLGESMAYGGAAAAAAGMDIEQTIAIFAAFADAGIKGSRAGTTFEAVMRDLRDAVEDGHIAIGNTKIAVYDLDGNMRSLTDIMLDVEAATAGMTTQQRDAALAAIFGTQALRGVNIMLETGVGNIKAFEGELYNSQGTADSTAAVMRDNLKGAVEELMSAFEGLAIEFSDILTPKVRELTEKLTELTQRFIELDDATKETIIKWAAIVAAIGPVVWVFGKLLGTISTIIRSIGLFIEIVKTLAPVWGWITKGAAALKGALAALAAALGLPVGAVAAIIAAIVALGVVVWKYWDEIKAWTIEAWGVVVEWFTETLPQAFNDFIEWVKDLWTQTKEYFSKLWNDINTKCEEIWTAITTWIGDAVDSVVTWFQELPEKIGQLFSDLGAWISETAIGIWESLTTWIGEAVDNVVMFFSEMPERVMAFIYELFTEKIPFAIGFAVGWVIRTLIDLIDSIVTFFSELPGKVWIWLQKLWEDVTTTAQNIWESFTTWISNTVDDVVTFFKELPGKVWTWLQELWTKISETVSRIWETATTWISKTVNDIVEWFKALPGRIWEWLTQAYNNVVQWGTNVYTTAERKVSETITAVVNWFKELPTRIWTWLTEVINKVKTWASEIWKAARQAAVDLVNGFIEKVKELPGLVWDAIIGVKDTIVGAAESLYKAAKTAASNLWNGFKKGLGIASPSYLEEAMMAIMDKSYEMTTQLGGDFKKLSRMSVKPEITPFSSNPERYPDWGGGGLGLVGVGGFSGPLIQIEKMEVRSDDDIKRLSRELKGHIDDTLRGEGYK